MVAVACAIVECPTKIETSEPSSAVVLPEITTLEDEASVWFMILSPATVLRVIVASSPLAVLPPLPVPVVLLFSVSTVIF